MTTVRRIQADEWREVKALRLDALADPVADLAFLDTLESASAQPDAFWQDRARGGAESEDGAQFVATADDGTWIGSVTVLRHGERTDAGLIVGVYVSPRHRGAGAIETLLDAAQRWTRERGWTELALEVHEDNTRAIAAYERCGFTRTGELVHHGDGVDHVMSRSV